MFGAVVVVGMWFPCGEPVDRLGLSEVTFSTFVPGGLQFVAIGPDLSPFSQGARVRPLAARTRQNTPPSTSQLDVSLPMSERRSPRPTGARKLFHKAVWTRPWGRVSPDET